MDWAPGRSPEVLADSGDSVTGLAAAADALERLPILRPDLIVMDMTMPGMDGVSLLRKPFDVSTLLEHAPRMLGANLPLPAPRSRA